MNPNPLDASRRKFVRSGAALAAAAVLPVGTSMQSAMAQGIDKFPSRPITIVVPYAPGALNDTLTRTLAKELENRLGVNVLVANRPGAGAQIGLQSVARAAPDGYTLVMGSNAPLAELPVLKKGVTYKTPEDFTFVARVSANNPWLMVSSNRLAAKTLPEIVRHAKENPGAIRYGSIGMGSGSHLAMALLESETGAKFTHVPYSGAAPVVNAVLAGEIDIGLTGIGTMFPHRNSDKVRYLAVTGSQRNPHFPQVPTTVELGFKSVLADIWFGIVGPAGIPAPIVDRLSKEINAALNDRSVRELLARSGLEPAWQDSASFTNYASAYIDDIRTFSRTPAGKQMMEDMGS